MLLCTNRQYPETVLRLVKQIAPSQGPDTLLLMKPVPVSLQQPESMFLTKHYCLQTLYNAALENNCSEQASRMAAMESSTKNATEMLGKLTLSYNRCACTLCSLTCRHKTIVFWSSCTWCSLAVARHYSHHHTTATMWSTTSSNICSMKAQYHSQPVLLLRHVH